MSGALEHPGHARSVQTPSSRADAAVLGPAYIKYQPDNFGAWSHLPPELAASVAPHLAGDRLVAWVAKAKTLRRANDYCQHLTAWWASPVAVAELTATRPLTSIDGHRFRPCGPWTGHADLHQLLLAHLETKTWTRRSGGGPQPALPPREVHDSLLLLPEPLQGAVAGGPPAGALRWDNDDGTTTEEVMAYCLMAGTATLLYAWRGPAPAATLEAQPWRTRLLNAAVASSTRQMLQHRTGGHTEVPYQGSSRSGRLPSAAPRSPSGGPARRLLKGST